MVRLLRIVLLVTALTTTFIPAALAQSSGTIFDEAGVLDDADKQKVQAAFDRVHAETVDPLYAFLVPDTNVVGEPARRAPRGEGPPGERSKRRGGYPGGSQ
jgi:hypothetical protein